MWDRVIIHSDINHCYAQIEEMMFPELREVPMVVGGSEESRHGIVLAKNDLAKRCHIKTGESLREAYQKCPDLLVVHPHYDDYLYYTSEVKNIYREYTDQVESFGLDEAWIDITSSQRLFGGDPIQIAQEIQQRIYDELGLTVSMGVSFNKIFAKLGSDLNKNKGLTVISRKNFKDIVYPLMVRDLFYVGQATTRKLNDKGIFTIGQIANSRKDYLKSFLGKNGEMIWYFANGMDISEVALSDYQREPQSIGNGITTIHDMTTYEEAVGVFRVLVESVSSRLKEQNLKGKVISIYMRDSELKSVSKQRKIDIATNISKEIMEVVENLLQEYCTHQYYFHKSYRSVSISVSHLCYDTEEVQLSLFVDEDDRQKEKRVDQAIDKIRNRFGFEKIKRCCVEIHKELTCFNPKDDHIIHPEGWFKS